MRKSPSAGVREARISPAIDKWPRRAMRNTRHLPRGDTGPADGRAIIALENQWCRNDVIAPACRVA